MAPSSPADKGPTPAAVPQENLWLGRWFAAARQSGLLLALSADEWQALSTLLSFLTREGRASCTLDQFAFTLDLTAPQAFERLEALEKVEWEGGPLVRLEYSLGRVMVGAVLAPLDLFSRVAPALDLPAGLSPLEEPPAPAASPDPTLVSALDEVGLYPDQIELLLQTYPAERIRRQLDWLPKRGARNPAALFLRAVEGDWGAPRRSRGTEG